MDAQFEEQYIVDGWRLIVLADMLRGLSGRTEKFALPDDFFAAITEIPMVLETIDENGNLTRAEIQGYKKLRNNMFYGNAYLTRVYFPEGVTSIGDRAFHGCTQLALTSLPESVTSIGDRAFYGCTQLALTSLPEGVTTIWPNAFYKCTNLALTSLPEGLTDIGTLAFYGCTSLKEITFKGTPRSIDKKAFASCSNLETIHVPWAEGAVKNAPWGATKATIHYNYTGD